MSPKVRKALLHWIPEVVVIVLISAVVSVPARLLEMGFLESWILALCFYAIFGNLIADSVRKAMTRKTEKDR